MSSSVTDFEFRPPFTMIVAWTLAGFLCFGFALFPWIMIYRQSGNLPTGFGAFILGGFCLFPLTISAWSFFIAFCRTRLSAVDKAWPGQNKTLHREKSIFGWTRTRDFEFYRAFLVIYRNHGGQTTKADRTTIFLRNSKKTALLASELDCSNIVELARWIATATGIKCIDIRSRGRGPIVDRDAIEK